MCLPWHLHALMPACFHTYLLLHLPPSHLPVSATVFSRTPACSHTYSNLRSHTCLLWMCAENSLDYLNGVMISKIFKNFALPYRQRRAVAAVPPPPPCSRLP